MRRRGGARKSRRRRRSAGGRRRSWRRAAGGSCRKLLSSAPWQVRALLGFKLPAQQDLHRGPVHHSLLRNVPRDQPPYLWKSAACCHTSEKVATCRVTSNSFALGRTVSALAHAVIGHTTMSLGRLNRDIRTGDSSNRPQ